MLRSKFHHTYDEALLGKDAKGPTIVCNDRGNKMADMVDMTHNVDLHVSYIFQAIDLTYYSDLPNFLTVLNI